MKTKLLRKVRKYNHIYFLNDKYYGDCTWFGKFGLEPLAIHSNIEGGFHYSESNENLNLVKEKIRKLNLELARKLYPRNSKKIIHVV